MSEHEISCIIIRQDSARQRKLEAVLRDSDFNVKSWHANNLAELKNLLTRSPMVLFFPSSGGNENEQKLLQLMQRLAPDCILAHVTARSWKGLVSTRNGGTDVCSIATYHPVLLQQQVDYLFAYSRLKAEFRQCKHLLSIAELRSQWLVDYAREAVAYIASGRHLHVNIAYLTLFGFSSEAEALAADVLNLVQPAEHKIFTPLSLAAEQGASPSNKLLMTLRTGQGKPFRAEIRFIPSVYHGRRCIQLHVHPLLRHSDREQAAISRKKAAEPKRRDPWQEKSAATQKRQQKNNQVSNKGVLTALTKDSVKQLHPAFKELLNLKGGTQPALLAARPWLQYTNKVKLDYQQLLANAHDDATRFRLDYWNLVAALKFLAAKQDYPLQQLIMVELGSWILRDSQKTTRVLKLLQKSQSFNNQLILALDVRDCMRWRQASVRLLPLLRSTGVGILFDGVHQTGRELLALLEVSGGNMIRLDPEHAGQITATGEIQRSLQVLLQQMSGRNVNVVINGVEDINALNLLCETTAGYLQGPILEKFSR
ncbi:MAG: EAL domain-containing protein [Thiolinea sp.]